jgi:hypothetical protein
MAQGELRARRSSIGGPSIGRSSLLALVLVLAATLVLAPAATASLTVNDDTAGTGPEGATCAAPDFATIQEAVDAAAPGSKVLVCAGSYAGAKISKELTLEGAQAEIDARERNAPAAEESIVSAASGAIFEVSGFRDVIDGFRLRSSGEATGVKLDPGSSETVVEDEIFASLAGKAVAGTFNKPTLRHNVVSGGGVGFESSGSASIGATVDANSFADTSVYDVAFLTGGIGIVITRNERSGGNGAFAVLYSASQPQIADNIVTAIGAPAVYLGGANGGVAIQRNSFTKITEPDEGAIAFADEGGVGANRRATIVGNVLTGNLRAISFAEDSSGSVFDVHFNRIVGNQVAGLVNAEGSLAAVDATNNWWGCNGGPGATGCDTVEGLAVYSPWLVIGLSATPATVYRNVGLSRLIADVSHNSDGVAAGTSFPNNTEIAFGTDIGSVSPPGESTLGGRQSSTFAAGSQLGIAHVTATLDNQTVSTEVKVVEAPAGANGKDGKGSGGGGTLALKRKMAVAFVRPVAQVAGGRLITVLRCTGTVAQRCVGKLKIKVDGAYHRAVYAIAVGRKARVKVPVPAVGSGLRSVRAVAVTSQVTGRPVKTARKLKLRWPAP